MKKALFALTVFALVAGCDSLSGNDEPPGNIFPEADFSFTPQAPRAGQTVAFTANASDSDGQIAAYSWDFDGDGTQDASGANPSWEFDRLGTYAVSLTVTDNRGGTDRATRSVSVSQRFNRATITSVTVLDMPFVDQEGISWDFGDGPDVYFGSYDQSGQPITFSSIRPNVVPGNLPFRIEDGDFVVNNLSARVAIALWDEDIDGDEFIGGIEFDLANLIGTYPASLRMDAGAGIVMEIALSWGFSGDAAS